jgi:hypothetical protein
LRRLVRRFDLWLSRRYGVFEFSQEPDCLLRLQLATARREIALPGCRVRRGEPLLLLHLWNERLPRLIASTPGLGGAKDLQRLMMGSLEEAARYMERRPELAERRAVGGVTVLLEAGEHAGGARLVERLGFSVLPYRAPLGRFGEFWENFYTWVLMWTYNPDSLAYRHLWSLRRREFWMATEEFRSRFGETHI